VTQHSSCTLAYSDFASRAYVFPAEKFFIIYPDGGRESGSLAGGLSLQPRDFTFGIEVLSESLLAPQPMILDREEPHDDHHHYSL
jgi:hypothetical protein